MQRVNVRQQFAAMVKVSESLSGICLVLAALLPFCLAPVCLGQAKKNVLMIIEIGQSHPAPALVTNQILSALGSDPRFDAELRLENLDAIDLSDDARNELRDGIVRKYRNVRWDLIVLVGPDPLRLFAEPSRTFYPGVPVVFCCSSPGQADQRSTDSRSTGSWLQWDPAKTLDAAIRLLPDTRQVFVVAGHSRYDRALTAFVRADLNPYENRLNITYLTDLPMSTLLERVRHLPGHSIVLYLTFFKDIEERQFMNSIDVLPQITAASNSPVFGVSDTYLGRGIVGGHVVSFEDQGKIAARDVIGILGGKPPQDIPIVHAPSIYLFDWRELQRWKLDESKLPIGSTVLFRKPSVWQQNRRTVLGGLMLIAILGLLVIYFLFERKLLKRARKAQEQLSGLLINAQELERSRLASEIHDDFSQRLAVLSLGLETAAEQISEPTPETNRQMQELMESASELGADLHALSHQLHSSTLERLGLAAGVGSFCKEFNAQHGTQVAFSHRGLPPFVSPEIALCLFRIVQEGLRNVQKHSGAAHAEVKLELLGTKLHLCISDDGKGFDTKEASDRQGLGLWSMRERVRSVDGRFEVHSEKEKGTKIDVWTMTERKPDSIRRDSATTPAPESISTSERGTD
ncbi:MAG: histidine kinase [Terracidiphilus sp.]